MNDGRYIVFVYNENFPSSGWHDALNIKGQAATFNSLQSAIAGAEGSGFMDGDSIQVVDMYSLRVVYSAKVEWIPEEKYFLGEVVAQA